MSRTGKILIVIGSVILLLALLVFFANRYAKKEIETALENELSQLEYSEISVSVLQGNSTVTRPVFRIGKFRVEAEEFQLRDLDYSGYIFDGNITISKVGIIRPKVVYNKTDSVPTAAGEEQNKPQRKFRIKELELEGGTFRMVENDTAKDIMYMSLPNLVVREIELDEQTQRSGLPVEYESVNMNIDSLFTEMNEEHNIAIGTATFENEDLSLEHFQIIPKYNRREFDRRIPFEKDHVQLNIEDITIRSLSWGIKNDTLRFSSPFINISNPDLQIYRNKMLPDDPRIKPLYSKMLRELGVKLELDSIRVEGANIVYEENVVQDRPPGKVAFEEVNADIRNIMNTGLGREDFPQTVIDAEALFQGRSTLTLNWEFRVNNEKDEFNVSGDFAGIPANAMNSFLTPAMNVEVEGEIESLYYNFYGDPDVARGDMRLSYRDFKVNLLDEGEGKGLLSRLANLILKNDVVDEDIKQENVEAERDKTKSFWNYLWLCIRNGALKTFF